MLQLPLHTMADKPVESTAASLPPRVCDRCIRRKPGPPLGSHHAPSPLRKSRRSNAASAAAPAAPAAPLMPSTPTPPGTIETATATTTAAASLSASTPLGQREENDHGERPTPTTQPMVVPLTLPQLTPAGRGDVRKRPCTLNLAPHQVECLLLRYFDILKDASPIYSRDRFLQRFKDGRCSESLISTIVVIAAKTTGYAAEQDGPEGDRLPNWDACLDLLLSSSMLDEDLMGDALSLDDFRRAFILAVYEFHQFPGHQSWMRVGRVTRMAYRIGLDRLDHIRTVYADWRAVDDEDIQEWRALWWCIYRLDTYSNMACGTPYVIDDTAMGTSLLQSPATGAASAPPDADGAGAAGTLPVLYVPSDLDDVPGVVRAVVRAPATFMANVHNVTLSALRQAGLVLRLPLLHSLGDRAALVTRAERRLATTRLALPTGWLNPRRNALSSESRAAHHARLATVLHLQMAQLLLAMADPGLRQEGEDNNDDNDDNDDRAVAGWQRVLEACQDIAAVAHQWDSSFCLAVDPALSFVVFTALVFLDLYRKTALADPRLRRDLDHQTTVLHLQLSHFASTWTVPRLLLLSYESFHQSVSAPLYSRHIALILSRFEAPFHPRWLQFLSSAGTVLADSV
ncbi:hypothetical protein SPBR_08217 [Sporothrix brasiliensis 5110]|uniref:Xylanolytic transcriptional activator regulatory domain-containing protein n=1 Tax=Sporothrix brasiliensis 5110 TaxID=1398154 RepID=A0A0C2IN45_9PEZI|nr:uncharacterized protein SPBR_08217 [Sporothrix brasiliensis 5110]KIH86437.1 hypothetical protein SPBR_08217 [Sporothrix brasiliensis 5110]